MIRQTKKDLIISQVMGNYLTDSKMVSVTPGDITFVTMPVHNDTRQNQVYVVAIHDPDVEATKMEEVSLVYSANEMEHWAKLGKMKQPRSYDFIT